MKDSHGMKILIQLHLINYDRFNSFSFGDGKSNTGEKCTEFTDNVADSGHYLKNDCLNNTGCYLETISHYMWLFLTIISLFHSFESNNFSHSTLFVQIISNFLQTGSFRLLSLFFDFVRQTKFDSENFGMHGLEYSVRISLFDVIVARICPKAEARHERVKRNSKLLSNRVKQKISDWQ